MTKHTNLKLLSDKPTTPNSKNGSKFGYKDVSTTIIDIIDASPRPFTIGLFGKWGRGKSTVLEEVKLRIDRRKYTFVKFDVWKYEGDSLRRSFLVDVAGQVKDALGLWDKVKGKRISTKEIERKLYNSESAPKTVFKPNKKGLVVSAIAAVAIYLLTTQLESEVTLSLSIASLPLLVEIIKSIDPTQVLQKINMSKNPAGSPEQFEKIFKDDILQATRGTLVVAIDNLDRTQSHKTAELLSTIKTFLNSDDANENVVFLIAADNLAIKQHISKKYDTLKNSNFSADEFLQKFFNVSIDMPELISTEVGSYTADLLKKTGINLDNEDDVLYLISLFFNKNPREIKQFINNLVAFYMQIKNAQEINNFDASFLKDNTAFIVFLLIMREKYLDAFTQLKHDVMNGESWSTIKTDKLARYIDKNAAEYSDYGDFISKTRHVSPATNNISAFFSLRTSDVEKQLPGWDIFRLNLENGEVEPAVKLVKDFDTQPLKQQLVATLNGALGNQTRLTILSRTILSVIAQSTMLKNDKNFVQTLLEIILGNTREQDVEKVFTGENIRTALDGLPNVKLAVQKDFIAQLSNYLKAQTVGLKKGELKTESLLVESYLHPVLQYYDKNPSKAASWKAYLVKVFETTTDLASFGAAAEMNEANNVVSDLAYSNFLETITAQSIEDKTIVLQIDTAAKLTNQNRMPDFLLKVSEISTQLKDADEKAKIAAVLSNKLLQYPETADEPAQATVNALTQMLNEVYTSNTPGNHMVIKGILVISSSSTNTLKGETDSRINQYIDSEQVDKVIALLELAANLRAHAFDNNIKSRIVSDPGTYGSFKKYLDEPIRKTALSGIAAQIATYPEGVEYVLSLLRDNEGDLDDYQDTVMSALLTAYRNNSKRDEIKRISHYNTRTKLKQALKKPLRDEIKAIEVSETTDE